MHCNICDNVLSPEEIKEEPNYRGGYSPCRSCLDAVTEFFADEDPAEFTFVTDDATG